MIAVILVGGEGTRLRPLTLDRPKAMLPIGGRPFLAHMLERLAAAGVKRVVFSCGYLPDPIVAGFGDMYDGMALEYAVEPEPMDTAGAIRFAIEGRLDDGPFFALNGDVLMDAPLGELMAFHVTRGARATVTLTEVADPTRYGLVLTDDDGRVEAFVEKPEPGAEVTLAAAVLDQRRRLRARPLVPRHRAVHAARQHRARGVPAARRQRPLRLALAPATGTTSARRRATWRRTCTSRAARTVLGRGRRRSARARRSTAASSHEDAVIGAGAVVTDSVIGARVPRVGARARVSDGSIVAAAGVEIADGPRRVAGERVFLEVPDGA